MDKKIFNTLLAYTFALLIFYLLFTILSPFLTVLVWAGAIGTISYPLYEKLLNRCHGREMKASLLMITSVVLALIVPLVGLIFSISKDAALAYQYLENTGGGTAYSLQNLLKHPSIVPLIEKVRPLTATLNMELDSILLPAVKKGVALMLNYSTEFLKNFFGFFIKLILMLIALFFIYKDGAKFLRRFWLIVSINENRRLIIISTIIRVLGAVMYGIVLTCLVQGVLGGIGFWVAGLPSPFLFGAIMAICALIPIVGTSLIWLPGAVYLLLHDRMLYGILLIIWGIVAVSSIDNIIRPLFISGKAKLPIIVIALGVLGGFMAFGLSGVIAGPVILAVILVLFEIYREETSALEIKTDIKIIP